MKNQTKTKNTNINKKLNENQKHKKRKRKKSAKSIKKYKPKEFEAAKRKTPHLITSHMENKYLHILKYVISQQQCCLGTK